MFSKSFIQLLLFTLQNVFHLTQSCHATLNLSGLKQKALPGSTSDAANGSGSSTGSLLLAMQNAFKGTKSAVWPFSSHKETLSYQRISYTLKTQNRFRQEKKMECNILLPLTKLFPFKKFLF